MQCNYITILLCVSCRYNIGHVGTALGDLGLAYQAFKVAVSIDPTHGEALNNIAVLEMRRQKFDIARSCLQTSADLGPHLFEPLYNIGVYCICCYGGVILHYGDTFECHI